MKLFTHGTAIAAICNDTELVIASDSRVVDSDDNPLTNRRKIHVIGDIVLLATACRRKTKLGIT